MRYMTLAEFHERYGRDRRTRYPHDARSHDWVRIGDDMRRAVRRVDEELGERGSRTR